MAENEQTQNQEEADAEAPDTGGKINDPLTRGRTPE